MLIVWDKKTKKIIKAQSRHPEKVTIDEIADFDPDTMDYDENVDDRLVGQTMKEVETDERGNVVKVHEDVEAVSRLQQREAKDRVLGLCIKLNALEQAQTLTGMDMSEEVQQTKGLLEKAVAGAKQAGVSFVNHSRNHSTSI